MLQGLCRCFQRKLIRLKKVNKVWGIQLYLHGFFGHFWHLWKPQDVPMVPQHCSCLVRPGRAFPHWHIQMDDGTEKESHFNSNQKHWVISVYVWYPHKHIHHYQTHTCISLSFFPHCIYWQTRIFTTTAVQNMTRWWSDLWFMTFTSNLILWIFYRRTVNLFILHSSSTGLDINSSHPAWRCIVFELAP